MNEMSGLYSFAFNAGQPTASTFGITATPSGAQAGDSKCGALAINHQGVKYAKGTDSSTAVVSACWR